MQTDRNFLSNYQGIGPCVCGAFHHSAYAVHNETSKAVEQLICDDRFRTRYGCSANQATSSADRRYCKRSRLSPRGRRHRLGC